MCYLGSCYLSASSQVSVQTCMFEGNSAATTGGALSALDCTLDVVNTTFLSNNAQFGGGVYISSSTANQIEGTMFYTNAATLGGGGIYWDNISPSIEAQFVENHALFGDSVASGV
jgi:predicted outer membrane repeat protein